MKLLGLAVMSVLCTPYQALTLSTLATVSLAFFSLNKPVMCFFGVFRRRRSPIQETFFPEPEYPFAFVNQPFTASFNPSYLDTGGYFLPGFGGPSFTMLLNRNPSTPSPPEPVVRITQPKRVVLPEVLPEEISSSTPIPEELPQNVPSDAAIRDPRGEFEKLTTEEIENFFALLAETDVNKCIARFLCEVGANPESGGEFGQTMLEMIASLNDFPEGSNVFDYHEGLTHGMVEGTSACASKFPTCDDDSLQMVRSTTVEQ